MFQGFNSDLLSFCADIRFNNNKEFMDAHRKEYYAKMRDPYYAFIQALAPTMLAIDEDMEVRPHKCLSRINRDTRYTKDKSPYRDHHWVAFRRAAIPKDGMPFYWFEIRLESINWGLGVWGRIAISLTRCAAGWRPIPGKWNTFCRSRMKRVLPWMAIAGKR